VEKKKKKNGKEGMSIDTLLKKTKSHGVSLLAAWFVAVTVLVGLLTPLALLFAFCSIAFPI
jgi:hypothetical protein